MNFTKTLLAVALLATGSAAHASFIAGDAVLTVIDSTNSTEYAVDLGVTTAALQANPSLTFTTDALFATFVAGEKAGDAVFWNVSGGYSTLKSGKGYSDFVETMVTANVSDLATVFPNTNGGVTTITANQGNVTLIQSAQFANAIVTAGVAANSAISSGAWNTNIGGNVNDAAYGTALNLWQVARTGSAAITETLLATANFTATATSGTLVIGSTSGGTTSAVPLPTSVWMFLSGIVGLLSMKRRSSAAA